LGVFRGAKEEGMWSRAPKRQTLEMLLKSGRRLRTLHYSTGGPGERSL
jgi:hypothetical protein